MSETKRKSGKFARFMKFLTIICLGALVCAYLCPFVHPSTLWILPFFGLAYPVIAIITFLFLIYWTFKRSKTAIVVLVFILLGGGLHFRSLAVTFNTPAPEEGTEVWKIMSYNVRLFDVYNDNETTRNANRQAIISYVNDYQPDVVCFQEFYQQDAPSKFPTKDTLITLLDIKDYQERYSHKFNGRQNFGICMLSKYPMIAKSNVNLGTTNTDNYCVFADIVKGKDTLRIYNIHLQSIKLQQTDYALFGEKTDTKPKIDESTFKLLIRRLRVAYPARADQARIVVEHMESSPYPVVICGDFNDTPMSYVYNQFNKTMVDSYRETSNGIGKTYAGKIPAGRIDYIFHTYDLKASNFKIQEKAFSDHLAVCCEIWKPLTKNK